MGYPMAKNLRAGLGPDKTLLICDVNDEALSRFKQETEGQGPVEVISNGFEATKAAVGSPQRRIQEYTGNPRSLRPCQPRIPSSPCFPDPVL